MTKNSEGPPWGTVQEYTPMNNEEKSAILEKRGFTPEQKTPCLDVVEDINDLLDAKGPIFAIVSAKVLDDGLKENLACEQQLPQNLKNALEAYRQGPKETVQERWDTGRKIVEAVQPNGAQKDLPTTKTSDTQKRRY